MKIRHLCISLILLSGAPGAWSQSHVCMETNLGEICMELYREQAPNTVNNFLSYMTSGSYDGSMVHRSVSGFVIQGGGFTYTPLIDDIPRFDPVQNEFSLSNTRGTVAMAKTPGNPDSATNQWFINLSDNSLTLDFDNGGYTVFAGITHGMDVVDAIAALQTVNLSSVITSAFSQVPVLDIPEGGIRIEDFVQVRRVYATDQPPALTQFDGQGLTFPVRIGNRLYSANLVLSAQSPDLVFNANVIAELVDSPQESASFNSATGILTIPSVQAGPKRLANVELFLTDSTSLAFTLQSYELVPQ